MSKSQGDSSADRVMSIDAFRGFVMLAMASSGFGFSVLAKPENLQKLTESGGAWIPHWLLKTLAYQFDHVAWTGCSFWDLIQPSFMFLVGVAVPFSYSRRESEGQSASARFRHVLWRSFVLVALGVFLSSNGSKQTNFTFVNVLSQIGLGYPVLYLLRERSLRAQFVAAAVILVGYWGWFANYTIPPTQFEEVKAAITARSPKLLEFCSVCYQSHSETGIHRKPYGSISINTAFSVPATTMSWKEKTASTRQRVRRQPLRRKC